MLTRGIWCVGCMVALASCESSVGPVGTTAPQQSGPQTEVERSDDLDRWLGFVGFESEDRIAPLGLGRGRPRPNRIVLWREETTRWKPPRPLPAQWRVRDDPPQVEVEWAESCLDLGHREVRVRLTWTRAGPTSHEGTQRVDLVDPGGRVVRSYIEDEVFAAQNQLWRWGTIDEYLVSDGDLFRDLDGDGIEDFGVVVSAYRTAQVLPWVSGGDEIHEPVGFTFEAPALRRGVLVERIGPYDSLYGLDWSVRVTDLRRSSEPRYHRRYGVLPDTLSPDGGYVIYRYENPYERPFVSLDPDATLQTPDVLLGLDAVPILDRPFLDSESFVAEVYESRTRRLRDRLVEFSSVYAPPRESRREVPFSHPVLSQIPSLRDRARYAITILP